MSAVPVVDDAERRARLGRRHGIAPAHRAPDAVAAVRAMTVLHATEPATVHLSLHARVDGLTNADVDHELETSRALVKQLAMRRTLFVFPRDLLPAAWGSASARVLAAERNRIAKDVVALGVAPDGHAWLDAVRARVLDLLADAPDGLTALELRPLVPELATPEALAAGAGQLASRVVTNLGLSTHLVRGANTQHWRLSRPRWTLMDRWLDTVPAPMDEAAGYAVLVDRWLRTFGPGTEADLVWWLGATKGAVRRALADVAAVPVALEGGSAGWVAADDPVLAGERTEVEPWAALLPVLDPTVMGWRERDFHLGPHQPVLFDRNGNAGTTAWWDGRVVGCWTQDPDGAVAVRPVVPLPPEPVAALRVEAARLTAWLAGVRVGTVYPSPAMRADEADCPYPVLRA
ncbi:AlkZ family DNA glycosylase [Nocardioides sp. ChNu-153]|uniref:winged helix DNA-binding domain-containing protein n=1 Tax=unclassified Nocardioides TaxID=2615069 RepID=UPI00240533D3|nr:MULTISPECIES: winged helix DNA-binding domain-containing protein [unclassified Nocardioides]MDF9714527.1 winged helix DNA-binding domain-containing protein [Nocardioides sp. ChNu-99]MDN7119940.1 AlkZ family DNA glycosylase [Nocardioides sp. ChNu-153]